MKHGTSCVLACCGVLAVTVIIMAAGCGTSDKRFADHAEGSTSTSPDVEIGQHGTLDSGAENTVLLDSEESFGEWLKSEAAGDQDGKVQLARSGRAQLVKSGARILVIDSGRVMTIPIAKVRVLDGEYAGKAGWASARQVKP